ncbi:uncharacterized protein PFL1_04718 [Pseudozyma flocculosa PF-1]|uniref:Related to multidrug resistant protein n=2 Tax=Pseudozyma flocculosa TaxID=84751 RepID=A0A5C3F461_9BASI|nr:uncharacterized protein PFL1_04718 [Pseudozyma flocculosa PF-1]EPQ27580.1 hypothetical protein PFL1_04718 [Pseudozyma flocculosa PF-1]SPO39293.1 related to multidrug resistant protein [Pseudozyma flocculosa]
MASLVPLPRPAHLRHQSAAHSSHSHSHDPNDDPSQHPPLVSPLLQPLSPDEVATITLVGAEDSRHWSPARKWLTTSVISLMGFVSPLGSSILVPGSKYLDFDFDLASRVVAILPVSFFVLGLGVGPFILAPISELKGRLPVYTSTSLLFIIFNLASSFSQTYVTLNILRFLAGAAGSAGPSLGAGSIGDMFEPRERGRAQAIYGLGPLLGPVLGNVIGGFIAQGDRDWRWLLFTLTIMSLGVFVAIVLFLKETYAPILLRKKRERAIADRLELIRQQQQQQQQQRSTTHVQQAEPPRRPSPSQRLVQWAKRLYPSAEAKAKIKQAQSRPFRLLFTNPICAIFSLYLGFCYGIVFLFLTQHPLLFQERDADEDLPTDAELPTYSWTLGVSGLSYLGLGLGFLASALTNVLVQDNLYRRLVQTDGKICKLLLKDADEIERIMAARKGQQQQHQLDDQQGQGQHPSKDVDLEKQKSIEPVAPGPDSHTAAPAPAVVTEKTVTGTATGTGDATPAESCGSDGGGDRDRNDDGDDDDGADDEDAVRPMPKQDENDPAATVASWGVVPDPAATSSKLTPTVSAEGDDAIKAKATGTADKTGPASAAAAATVAATGPPGSLATAAAATSSPTPKKGRPEYRLPLCFVGMLILPCGLFCFGWSAESEAHWLVPLLGSFLVGYATILCFQTILVYLVDAFVPYSASATACAVLVRSLLAAIFPLLGEVMLEGIGYGWTSSLLAFVALAGAPVPVVLFRYGERIRTRHKFAG